MDVVAHQEEEMEKTGKREKTVERFQRGCMLPLKTARRKIQLWEGSARGN